MARDLTPHQKGIVRRYYDHRDTLALQKLAEIVSNLYLEETPARRKRMWAAARKNLLAAGVHRHQADAVCDDEDLGALAKLVGELT